MTTSKARTLTAVNVVILILALIVFARSFQPVRLAQLTPAARASLVGRTGPPGLTGQQGIRGPRGLPGVDADTTEILASISQINTQLLYLCEAKLLTKPADPAAYIQWLTGCPG